MTLAHPSTFAVRGLPRQLFGETYAIISVWQPDDTTWKAEYNILTKVPNEYLMRDVVPFYVSNDPDELQKADEGSMEKEAIREAERVLTLELERRALDANQEDLAYLPVSLKRANINLSMLWKLNTFPTKFHDMATNTTSPRLKTYLGVLMTQTRLAPPP